jgi:hypothetical protein
MVGGRMAALEVDALFFFLLFTKEVGFFFFAAGATAVRLREGRTEEEVLAAWRAEWRVVETLEAGIVKTEF